MWDTTGVTEEPTRLSSERHQDSNPELHTNRKVSGSCELGLGGDGPGPVRSPRWRGRTARPRRPPDRPPPMGSAHPRRPPAGKPADRGTTRTGTPTRPFVIEADGERRQLPCSSPPRGGDHERNRPPRLAMEPSTTSALRIRVRGDCAPVGLSACADDEGRRWLCRCRTGGSSHHGHAPRDLVILELAMLAEHVAPRRSVTRLVTQMTRRCRGPQRAQCLRGIPARRRELAPTRRCRRGLAALLAHDAD